MNGCDCSTMLTKTTTSSFSRPGSVTLSEMVSLPSARPLGGEPSEPAAQIRVPDVAPGIDGDSERPRVAPWQRELGDDAIAQAAQPLRAQLREPHRAVGRGGQRRQPRRSRRQGELGEAVLREAPDLVRLHFEEPDGTIRT